MGNETCDAEVHVCARRSGEEVDKSCIHKHKAEQSRFDDKVPHIRRTQERLCDDRIETRLKQNREVTEQREGETKRRNVRRSQSAVMKKKRRTEGMWRSDKMSRPQGEYGEQLKFLSAVKKTSF